MSVVAAGSVGEDRRIQYLSAAGAFPGIKGTDEVIKFLSEHTALAAWTLHGNPPDDVTADAYTLKGITPCVPRAAAVGN
jgi:hypothetical protein